MHRTQVVTVSLLTVMLLGASGCSSVRTPTTATKLEPPIQAKVQKGVVEPGFTPEMVFMALGKPSEPTSTLSDTASNGIWIYHDYKPNGGDFLRAGFRRHVVFDAKRKADVVLTEPIDAPTASTLRENSLTITFREGRVVDIQRVAAR
jgi:hypothetical protein